MDGTDLSYLGYQGVSHDDPPFGIPQVDRRQHLYTIGRTGTGKTTLLRNLIIQDIEAGRGLALIDPHGDLAADILEHIPAWRTDEVIVFDPSDLERPLGLNVLAHVPLDQRPLVADNVVAIFRHLWGLDETATPRLLRLLSACVSALLDFPPDPGATLLGVPRMLVDERYRARVVRHIQNPKVRSFFTDELPQWDKRYLADATAASGNVIETFLTSPVLRNIFGQPKSSFSMRAAHRRRRHPHRLALEGEARRADLEHHRLVHRLGPSGRGDEPGRHRLRRSGGISTSSSTSSSRSRRPRSPRSSRRRASTGCASRSATSTPSRSRPRSSRPSSATAARSSSSASVHATPSGSRRSSRRTPRPPCRSSPAARSSCGSCATAGRSSPSSA